MKKTISLFLSFVMLLSITAGLDMTAFAKTYSGTCGENITWSLNTNTGVLTLDGTGDMTDYFAEVACIDSFDVMAPWYANGCLDYVKTVNISDGITSIGDGAFWNCSNLTNITIPDSVTKIGKGGFYSCESLTSITIPASVTSIGDYAFAYSNLKSISVDDNNTVFDSRNNCNAIIKTKTNTLVLGCQNTVIPNTVTSIGKNSFIYCTKLKTITIPNSVKSIGDSAFYYCSSLTSIALPKSVTKIGKSAFYGCTKLSNVYYGSSKKNWNKISIKSDNSCLTDAKIHFNAYPKSTSVKKLTKKSKAFKVTWTKKSSVNGYQIQYATNQKFTKNKKTVTIKKSSSTSKTIKGLKSKKTYYVRVRTYKTVSGKKVYSNWSTAKKVTTK